MLMVFLAGCSTNLSTEPDREARTPQETPAEVWEYPAGEFPATCMLFMADGRLQFRGGFLFFNPSQWARDTATGMVNVVLGGDVPFSREGTNGRAADHVAVASSLDPSTRTLRYRITHTDKAMEFGGLIFYRSATCSAL
jgi:hypothetical protein